MDTCGDNRLRSKTAKQMHIPKETIRMMASKSGGFPEAELKLKIGVTAMLLRNLSVHDNLCNGTRVTVLEVGSRYIKVATIDGTLHLIPRIKFITDEYGYRITRIQFPLGLCYAMNRVVKNQIYVLRIYLLSYSHVSSDYELIY